MSDKLALRIGAVGGIVGGAFGLIFNILHPRGDEETLTSVPAHLTEIAESDIWVADHMGILLSVLLLLGALYGITRSIKGGKAEEWARLAWYVALPGIGFLAVTLFIDGIAMNDIAGTFAASSGEGLDLALAAGTAVNAVSSALFTGIMILTFGVVPLLYGAALLSGDTYAKWLGYVVTLAGAITLVTGVLQAFNGLEPITAFILFPIGSILFTLWVIDMGFIMMRKAAAMDTPAEAADASA